MNKVQDTICALATPNGVGAIALIRVSGSDSWSLVSSCFSKALEGQQSHTAHYGFFKTLEGEPIDEVLITLFAAGKSFTGEESVEITCHASPYIQQQLLQVLVKAGCRLANPGEYTMRAFMNGKLDLSQAEAVADLIASTTRASHAIALKQLRGKFSGELKMLREQLIHFASLVELELDFSEEDVEFADRTELKRLVAHVLVYLRKLIHSFELGNAIKEGVPVAIVGAPNTGKSTLLNQLLGEERALVSDIAGTTRDVIEETLNIGGVLFRLIDTAGIREGAETIEAMGIERSKQKIEQAGVVLCLADLALPHSLQSVIEWGHSILKQYPDKHVIIVGNKSDIGQSSQKSIENCGLTHVLLSAKSGHNVEALKELLLQEVMGGFDLSQDTIVSNARHVEALRRTEEALVKTEMGLVSGTTGDFIAMDIRQAMFHLGSITGDISSEDLLGNIFARFCIGK